MEPATPSCQILPLRPCGGRSVLAGWGCAYLCRHVSANGNQPCDADRVLLGGGDINVVNISVINAGSVANLSERM
jgi:hypothetical protein